VGVRTYRELIAWQLADQLDTELVRLVMQTAAKQDFKYRTQILDASSSIVSNITEGFLRRSRKEFSRYLGFSLASLGEAEIRLLKGVKVGFFSRADCETALRLFRRCTVAIIRLKHSQDRHDGGAGN
jgi:four helix bundle protein